MKHKYSKVAIVVLSIIIVAIFAFIIKNSVVEYKVTQKFKSFDGYAKSVNCSGFIDTTCVISSSGVSSLPLIKSFDLTIDKLHFNNPLAFAKIVNEGRLDDGDDFFLKVDSVNFISKEYSDRVDVLQYFGLKKSANRLLIKLRDSSIVIKKRAKGYKVLLDIDHNEVNNLLYNIYKLEFLELKHTNGTMIASGFNMSLGVNSPNLIKKEDFLRESLPMFIELLSSEITSQDWFIDKSYVDLLKKILDDLFELNGKKEYTI